MFWKKLLELCAKNSTTPSAVCKTLGLSNATATHWKQGAQPNPATLTKVANFFNVSVDYLLGKEKKPSAESEELIKKLLEGGANKAHYIMFGGASPEVREIPPEAEAIIKSVLETFDKKNND